MIICLAHNHHIAGQQLMLINQPSYKIYRYIIVGEQGVGKTNLITRFTQDQFVDNHNLMLQGQQTAVFHLNRCKYKLVFEDQHNVTSLSKLPLQFFQTINGIIFVFSFDNQKTFEAIEKELVYLQESILPTLNTKRTQISTILVGNKTDKLAPSLEIEDCKGQLKISNRTSLQQRARLLSSQANMKYFEISSKCSPKKQIQKLYIEMINQNDINTFRATEKEKRMWQRALSLDLPCSSTQHTCIIY